MPPISLTLIATKLAKQLGVLPAVTNNPNRMLVNRFNPLSLCLGIAEPRDKFRNVLGSLACFGGNENCAEMRCNTGGFMVQTRAAPLTNELSK